MGLAEEALADRRVVAKLPAALYVRLYVLKLKRRMSLERLLIEAVTLLIERHDQCEREAQS